MAPPYETNRQPMRSTQSLDAATVPRKPSNTEQALNALEGISSRLDALVSELERRVSPALLPASPENGAGEQRGNSSPLADKMFNEESNLRRVAERLDSIISRIDL